MSDMYLLSAVLELAFFTWSWGLCSFAECVHVYIHSWRANNKETVNTANLARQRCVTCYYLLTWPPRPSDSCGSCVEGLRVDTERDGPSGPAKPFLSGFHFIIIIIILWPPRLSSRTQFLQGHVSEFLGLKYYYPSSSWWRICWDRTCMYCM